MYCFLLIGLTYSCDENTFKTNETTTKTNETTTKINDLKEMGFHGNIETIVETEYKLSTKFGEEQIGEIRDIYITKFNNDVINIESWT